MSFVSIFYVIRENVLSVCEQLFSFWKCSTSAKSGSAKKEVSKELEKTWEEFFSILKAAILYHPCSHLVLCITFSTLTKTLLTLSFLFIYLSFISLGFSLLLPASKHINYTLYFISTMRILNAFIITLKILIILTCDTISLWSTTPQNGQTHLKNSSPTGDKLFECVWPFCGVGAYKDMLHKPSAWAYFTLIFTRINCKSCTFHYIIELLKILKETWFFNFSLC